GEGEGGVGGRRDEVLVGRGGQGASGGAPERIEPSLSPQVGAPEPETRARQVLVESVDFIIPIEGAEDVAGASVLDAAGPALDRCARSVHLEGFDEKLVAGGLVDPDRSYSGMRAGLQHVHPRGPAAPDRVAAVRA